jgi:hypothetical protein
MGIASAAAWAGETRLNKARSGGGVGIWSVLPMLTLAALDVFVGRMACAHEGGQYLHISSYLRS